MDRRTATARLCFGVVALLVAAATAGCMDSGLPGRNTPQAEAEQMVWSYPAYEASGAHAVMLGEEQWMVAGPPIRIPENLLTAVAGDHEAGLFALTTDSEPYSRLYQKKTDGWIPLARVPVQTGEAEAH